jgi:integrase
MEDQRAWEALFVEGSFFDDGGACAHWSDGSRGIRRQAYGQWLSFIRRTCPELMKQPPPLRVSPVHVEAFIDELARRVKPRTISGLVASLTTLCLAMSPDRDWAWLRRAEKRLARQSNAHVLKPRIPLSAAAIYLWSLKRMAQIEDEAGMDPLDRAVRFRQALMVGLLISRPLRSRAFVQMQLYRHLVETSEGFQLQLHPEDMKDRRARRYPVPDRLVTPMRRYLSTYRPVLLGETDTDALWISKKGKPLSQDSFTCGLALLTKRVFGLKLRPHAFRHIAATSIAEFDPAHVGIIRDILGHATLNMAERHYNRASSITASNQYQTLVQSYGDDGGRSRRRRRRR